MAFARLAGALWLPLLWAIVWSAPGGAQNLLTNPSFNSDVAGWSATNGGSLAWNAADADGLAGSGSLQLTNAGGDASWLATAEQCVPAVGGTAYSAEVTTFIPAGQARTGTSVVQWLTYSAPGCNPATLINSGMFGGVSAPDLWVAMPHTIDTPAGTRSVMFRPGTIKAEAGGSLVARYDKAFFGLPGSTCPVSGTDLCLDAGRFHLTATWRTAAGQSGVGHAVQLTRDTGYFWFFSETNVEIVVKVLDACGFNERYWVYAGGLTDVEVTMTVVDLVAGATSTYHNPLGAMFQPIQDSNAFATCP
jgi:hypothetical protein